MKPTYSRDWKSPIDDVPGKIFQKNLGSNMKWADALALARFKATRTGRKHYVYGFISGRYGWIYYVQDWKIE